MIGSKAHRDPKGKPAIAVNLLDKLLAAIDALVKAARG
jgi:hypothetical protein